MVASLGSEVFPEINGMRDTTIIASNEDYESHGRQYRWWHPHSLHQLDHHLLLAVDCHTLRVKRSAIEKRP
jgi:hypothetical protein